MAVVLSNAEPLSRRQAEEIERAFGTPVRNSYGMAEIVAAASECRHGSLHLWPEVGVVEERETLVCTGLINTDMPLIRYDIGDTGRLAPPDRRCACGRTLPLLEAIEGRTDDEFVTREGRRVAWINSVFKVELPIREAQVVQETLDRIRVRLVPAKGYDAEAAQVIRRGLRDRMGDVEIVVEELEHIPRGPNGKLRAVVSNVGR